MMDTFQKSAQHALLPDARQQLLQPSKVSEGIGACVWGWWAALTGPVASGNSLEEQERQRRACIISSILLVAAIILPLALLLSAFNAAPSLLHLIAIIIFASGFLSVALLNRRGHTVLSALLCELLIDMIVASYLIIKPALTINALSEFDLFILVALVGGATLPRAFIPLTVLIQIMLITGMFFLRPHDSALIQLIQQQGDQVYRLLMFPILLQLVGAGIIMIYTGSVERTLKRVNRVEELVVAQAKLARQATQLRERDRSLKEGITQILAAQRQIAAGNLSVGVCMREDHELWQIGQSLNQLLKRLNLQAQEYRTLRQTQQEIELLTDFLFSKRARAPLSTPLICRTPLSQRLFLALGL